MLNEHSSAKVVCVMDHYGKCWWISLFHSVVQAVQSLHLWCYNCLILVFNDCIGLLVFNKTCLYCRCCSVQWCLYSFCFYFMLVSRIYEKITVLPNFHFLNVNLVLTCIYYVYLHRCWWWRQLEQFTRCVFVLGWLIMATFQNPLKKISIMLCVISKIECADLLKKT